MAHIDDLIPRNRSRRPVAARGRIAKAPAAAGDGMTVVLVNYSSMWEFEVPASNWTLVGDLPVTGGRCLVVFDDDGDAWVPNYGAPDG